MIYLAIILPIYFISKGIRDRIEFRPDDFWFVKNKKLQDWILARGENDYDQRSWLTKHIFSFLADGWHFFDSLCVLCLCTCLAVIVGLDWWTVIVFYYGGGVIFEITYNVKLKNNKEN
jgi:hypothetical protein